MADQLCSSFYWPNHGREGQIEVRSKSLSGPSTFKVKSWAYTQLLARSLATRLPLSYEFMLLPQSFCGRHHI